jgi:tetratricopeptide (TPR) repeat protein
VVFAVYAAGACPTIYVGDSGELVAAVHVLGIPHPSGYPLYVLLGKLWTLLLPTGGIAYRMSLFSAACGASACAAVYGLCRAIGLGLPASALSALLLAFAPSFWAEANVQRVYTLNALFVALATAAAFAWHRSRAERPLVLAFLLCGLGAANHTFMAIQGFALALFALATEPRIAARVRTLLRCAAAFAVGLLPYAYLPLRSRADPPLDWGNPETMDNFLDVVLRRDFWGRAWIQGPADLVPIAADYLHGLASELLWVSAALAAAGVIMGWRQRWPVLLPLLVMAGNLAAMALHGSRSDIFIWHRYYIPSYLMAAVLAGMGCRLLLERAPRAIKLLPLAVPLFALVTGWRAADRSGYRIAEDFSRTLLATLPPGAHLAANDDNILFVLIYLHMVEQVRPDLDLILQGVGEANLPPLRFNPETDPLYLTHHPNWSLAALQVLPVGLVFKAVRAGQPPPPIAVPKTELEGESDPRVPKDYLTQNLIGHFHFMLGSSLEARDWPAARAEFERAQAAAPRNDVLFYNLGLVYARAGLLEEALRAFERAAQINPRPIPGGKEARAPDRVAETRAALDRQRALEASLGIGAPRTAEQHREMADLLEARGERAAAHGHRLRAQTAPAGTPP